jgi:hypothetical protein
VINLFGEIHEILAGTFSIEGGRIKILGHYWIIRHIFREMLNDMHQYQSGAVTVSQVRSAAGRSHTGFGKISTHKYPLIISHGLSSSLIVNFNTE